MHENSLFNQKNVCLSGTVTITKDIKCLDVSIGRVYISHNVIFDENVFPFSQNSNPGSGIYCANDLLTNVQI
jgi:hypothetical protein